jgi:hypothetical protein
MTSRRLWLLLTVLATPMIVYATAGCDLVFKLEEVPHSNAYTCACTCNPGPRERVSPSAAPQRNDDADERRTDGSVLLGGSDLRMTTDFLVGMRFPAVGLPKDAQIISAYVALTAAQANADTSAITIGIEASDDAPEFAGTTANVSARTLDPTTAAWAPGPWTSNSAQQTAELKDVIQAIVNRAGWTTLSSIVLVFDASAGTRVAVSNDGAGSRNPVLHVTYRDPGADVTATLPVCLPPEINPVLNENAPSVDADGDGDGLPDLLVADCGGRVENTYRGMVAACGYFPDPATNCSCQIAATNFHDDNENNQVDPGEAYFTFVRETCNHQPDVCEEQVLNLPADPDDPARCDNFDPVAFAQCVEDKVLTCTQNSIPPAACDTSACLADVAATNAPGDAPVCIAHASDAPPALAFQLFGRRSTCDVTGTSEIKVGDEGREPKHDPLTRGTIEIFGGPCPGGSCPIGIATQLGMNPITFDVKWHSDPTFTDLIEAGNSVLTAATIDATGAGVLPAESAAGVGRGRRSGSSEKKAALGTNEQPLDVTVDWAGFACSLSGNLSSTVDAEDPDGLCADGTTVCHADSPDCDDAGGPCTFGDPGDPFVVNVALAGTLVNQPPTADAGGDQTVECTSPAGASFVLDGTQSSDPDGDIRVVSWRQGTRTGQEVGFEPTLPVTIGVGESQHYVLRVLDSFAQMDEDGATAAVVDTTPPEVFCNAPATIVPSRKPVEFSATATDVCTASVVPTLVDYQCFKINGAGRVVDKTKSCKVSIAGSTITIDNTGGVGQHIAWTASGVDGSGNETVVDCDVVVANPGHS